jgi:hypothetical protein
MVVNTMIMNSGTWNIEPYGGGGSAGGGVLRIVR